jgi:hypothetical protein
MMFDFIRATWRHRDEMVAWQRKHDAHAPRAGDQAPDFELTDVTGQHRVRLSDFRGDRPVALVFGSFT